jgi:hypothetical protein
VLVARVLLLQREGLVHSKALRLLSEVHSERSSSALIKPVLATLQLHACASATPVQATAV